MGCDIHGNLEVKEEGKWKFIEEIPNVRSYDMFGILAGVRNYVNAMPISEPRGCPEDISDGTNKKLEHWDFDGHSHSWLTYRDFLVYDWSQVFKDGRISTIDKATGKEMSKASYTYLQDHPNPKYVLDYLDRLAEDLIPESWEKFLRKMGKLAFKYGSRNVRIVFWFDN